MSLKTDLMSIGFAPEQAQRLGLDVATLAGVGTSQSGAAAITAELTLGTTAGGQTAFVLPDAELLKPYVFINTSPTTALLFPSSGLAINGGSTNASISVPQNGAVILWRVSATAWRGLDPEASAETLASLTLGGTLVTATAAEINNAADVDGRVEEITATAAITAGKQSVELNSINSIVATMADAGDHQGLFIIKATGHSDDHTFVITSGTIDGTNAVALFEAANDALVIYFDSNGDGTIVENIGSVSLG